MGIQITHLFSRNILTDFFVSLRSDFSNLSAQKAPPLSCNEFNDTRKMIYDPSFEIAIFVATCSCIVEQEEHTLYTASNKVLEMGHKETTLLCNQSFLRAL